MADAMPLRVLPRYTVRGDAALRAKQLATCCEMRPACTAERHRDDPGAYVALSPPKTSFHPQRGRGPYQPLPVETVSSLFCLAPGWGRGGHEGSAKVRLPVLGRAAGTTASRRAVEEQPVAVSGDLVKGLDEVIQRRPAVDPAP